MIPFTFLVSSSFTSTDFVCLAPIFGRTWTLDRLIFKLAETSELKYMIVLKGYILILTSNNMCKSINNFKLWYVFYLQVASFLCLNLFLPLLNNKNLSFKPSILHLQQAQSTYWDMKFNKSGVCQYWHIIQDCVMGGEYKPATTPYLLHIVCFWGQRTKVNISKSNRCFGPLARAQSHQRHE